MTHKNYSFLSKFKKHVNTSMVLIFFTVLALVVANIPGIKDWYFSIWQIPVSLSIGEFNFFSHGGHAITLGQMINDFLMAIFFLSVGLEIKREIKVGDMLSAMVCHVDDENGNVLHSVESSVGNWKPGYRQRFNFKTDVEFHSLKVRFARWDF